MCRATRIWVTSRALKGFVIVSRESLVICAFSREEVSWRRERGFRASWGGEEVMGMWRVVRKVVMRVVVVVRVFWRVRRGSGVCKGGMVDGSNVTCMLFVVSLLWWCKGQV